jgi:hypothetical protein
MEKENKYILFQNLKEKVSTLEILTMVLWKVMEKPSS